jgi:murein tripeptide amidase MpaA
MTMRHKKSKRCEAEQHRHQRIARRAEELCQREDRDAQVTEELSAGVRDAQVRVSNKSNNVTLPSLHQNYENNNYQ